jgi:hypothetical protein
MEDSYTNLSVEFLGSNSIRGAAQHVAVILSFGACRFFLIKALLAYSSQGAMVLLWLAGYREICNTLCARDVENARLNNEISSCSLWLREPREI